MSAAVSDGIDGRAGVGRSARRALRRARGTVEVLLAGEAVGDPVAAAAGWRADQPDVYCRRCGASTGPGEATDTGCAKCRSDRPAWDGVRRLGAYDGALRQWILAMKFARVWAWGPWLGELLADQIAADGHRIDGQGNDEPTVVTYVPLHWRRRWGRGFDQSRLIAEALARRAGLSSARLLRRKRATRQQSLMTSKTDRLANVRRAFVAAPVDLRGWRVWLVDDVITTGATAGQCATLLRRAGAKTVTLAVAAVTDANRSSLPADRPTD